MHLGVNIQHPLFQRKRGVADGLPDPATHDSIIVLAISDMYWLLVICLTFQGRALLCAQRIAQRALQHTLIWLV